MSLIDITWPLDQRLPVYPGDPPFTCRALQRLAHDGTATSLLTMGSHTGTHLDAPCHFIPEGWDVASIPLELLVGEALVLDFSGHTGPIERRTLEENPRLRAGSLPKRLLFRTASHLAPKEALLDPSLGLTLDAAARLLELGVRLVGIDRLSIEPLSTEDFPVHRALLGACPPCVIVEGLMLSAVPEGCYELTCLPLRLEGGDAAPARVLLRGPAVPAVDREHDLHR